MPEAGRTLPIKLVAMNNHIKLQTSYPLIPIVSVCKTAVFPTWRQGATSKTAMFLPMVIMITFYYFSEETSKVPAHFSCLASKGDGMSVYTAN